MADLSEHLNWAGEFFLVFAGFILLLSMNPPSRRWARKRLDKICALAARLYSNADKRSASVHRWTIAFRMIFRERRQLLLVVGALLGFSYFTTLYGHLINEMLIWPEFENRSEWPYETPAIYYVHAYSLSILIHISYALFGWVAFRLATGDLPKGPVFRPLKKFVAFAFIATGANFLAYVFSPALFLYSDPSGWKSTAIYIATTFAPGALLCLIGARLLHRPLSGKIKKSTVSAILGYVVLTHLIQWFFWIFSTAGYGGGWIVTAERYVSDFAFTLLWEIAFVAFAVVLADPEGKSAIPSASDAA